MNNKNTITKKNAGILMPVASLPTDSGIGGFGKEARELVDILAASGMAIWQILPLNPLGFGNSPYQPFSSFAGDDLYIDLDILSEKGYLTTIRQPYEETNPTSVDYQRAKKYKEPYLREASTNFWKKDSQQEAFKNFMAMDWVHPYAVYIAIKKQNQLRCWNEWPKEQQNWILDHKYDISHLEEEINYQMFLQYEFYCQWNSLKQYANSKGIRIMGDLPFYVGIDSLDVWAAREDFLIDAEGKPTFIAGVPPDYFSATGQRWGNPIYNWENMQANDFAFWLKRLKYSSELYDIIRVDHFRAFDTYWQIPSACETAIDGEWLEAPGYQLLDRVFAEMPELEMVAEDLGDLRPEVLTLRDHYHLCGMNIAEFSVLSKGNGCYQQLVYTGTHDNQTVKGWYRELDKATKARVRKKLSRYGRRGESISWKMIHYICKSKARMAIIPVADILELDDSARLNTPGTVGTPNWEWRLTDYKLVYSYQNRLKKEMVQSGRIQ